MEIKKEEEYSPHSLHLTLLSCIIYYSKPLLQVQLFLIIKIIPSNIFALSIVIVSIYKYSSSINIATSSSNLATGSIKIANGIIKIPV